LSLEPKRGAPPPRIAEVASGMINAIGLENVGIKKFINEYLPQLKNYDTAIITNIFATSVDDFLKIIDLINQADEIDAIEINISCPNVKEGGILFGSNPSITYSLIKNIKMHAKKPIITKLTPNDCNIVEIAKAAEDAGSDALSLINTFQALAININKKTSRIGFGFGGLSGPCIKPIALRMVFQVSKAVKIPVIGIGGITSLNDVIEFLLAGADAVQIGTYNFIDPLICPKLVKELENYLIQQNINSIHELKESFRLCY
jgi:dihydroorotate dehydrogenase (NAD+) catalytic subunit